MTRTTIRQGKRWHCVRGVILACVAAVCVARADAAIIQVFNGTAPGNLKANWQAAVGPHLLEDFNDADADDFTIALIGPGHLAPAPVLTPGLLNDRLQPGSSTVLTFSAPILAFGANWNLAGPGGTGSGLRLVASGTPVPGQIPSTHGGQFYGFISDTPFTQVTLTNGTQTTGPETYNLDNVVYALAPVPEPSTIALAMLGAAACVAARLARRRRP